MPIALISSQMGASLGYSSLLASSSLATQWLGVLSSGALPAREIDQRRLLIGSLAREHSELMPSGENALRTIEAMEQGDAHAVSVLAEDADWLDVRDCIEVKYEDLIRHDLRYRRDLTGQASLAVALAANTPHYQQSAAGRYYGDCLDAASPALTRLHHLVQSGELMELREADRAMRQGVRDLFEASAYYAFAQPQGSREATVDKSVQDELDDLLDFEMRIYRWLQGIERVHVGDVDRHYNGDELADISHDILYRGRPLLLMPEELKMRQVLRQLMQHTVELALKVYPQEWDSLWQSNRRNLFNGEGVDKFAMPQKYRYARMLLNLHTAQPIFGPPSMHDVETVINFVADDLGEPEDDFVSAIQALRWHMRHLTAEFRMALQDLDLNSRAIIIENFFGPFRNLFVADPVVAFELLRFIGELGFYRELGLSLTYQQGQFFYVLTLGDVDSLVPEENEDIFIIHTHPNVDYRARTVDPEVVDNGENFIFSRGDIEDAIESAERLFLIARDSVSVPRIIYDPVSRIYSTWVQSHLGASRMRVSLNEAGKCSSIDISCAQQDGVIFEDDDIIKRAEFLSFTYSARFRIPVEISPSSYEAVEGSMLSL